MDKLFLTPVLTFPTVVCLDSTGKQAIYTEFIRVLASFTLHPVKECRTGSIATLPYLAEKFLLIRDNCITARLVLL